MAIKINTGKGLGSSMLPLFGVSTEMWSIAGGLGIYLAQPSPLSFVVYGPDGTAYGNVGVKGQSITLAKAGTLGPASKQAIQFQFEQAIQKAIHACGGVTIPKPMVALQQSPKFVGVKKNPAEITPLDALFKALENDAKSDPDPSIPYKPTGLAVTPLKSATHLLQKVIGTSPGSTYVVAAMFNGCNLAVKVSVSQLSVRLEGTDLSKYSSGFSTLGLDLKNGYASCHYSISNKDVPLLKKTFGAILATLGFESMIQVAEFSDVMSLMK